MPLYPKYYYFLYNVENQLCIIQVLQLNALISKILLFFIKNKSILYIHTYAGIVRTNLMLINKSLYKALTYFLQTK